jgi:CRP-like cAMP-binding protein
VPIALRVTPTNHLLSALPIKERERFLADCVRVELVLGTVLYEQGDRIRHVYFPIEGYISMLTTVDDRSTLEVGMIGGEGMCGYGLVLGGRVAGMRALVQGAGPAWRMDTAKFQRHVENSPVLRQLLGKYIDVLIAQLAQTAACTRFHVVEERLARWLLMTQDRAHAPSFRVTQEFLAFMLGVQRPGVTKAASLLQGRQLIRYVRGDMTIRDRRGLEAAACSCYRADLNSYKKRLAARAN